MPTYAYRCQDCGKEFERSTSMSGREKERPDCPDCQGRNVEQVMTPVSVRTSRKS